MRILRFAAVALALAACDDDDAPVSQAPDGSVPVTDAGTPTKDATPDEDAGSDAGSDAATGTIGAGPYAIAYSVAPKVGIDQRPSVGAVVSASGELDSYDAGADEHPERGTNQDGEHYVDAFSQIGRWNSGTAAGKYYAATDLTWTATQGFHHAMVVVPASLPTSGTVSYAFVKATSVTNDDGSSQLGTLTATGAVSFDAATRKTGLEISITVPGDATYTATTTGGAADPSQSTLGYFGVNNVNGNIPVTSTGAACAGASACTMNVRGFIGGGADGTARLVVAYVLGSGAGAKSLHGAFVLKAP